MTTNTDPSTWSIDQVIDQLCTESTLYQQVPIKKKYDLETLAEALRQNLVDGQDLLGLTHENIKNDLGIIALGARNQLMLVVKYLQEISNSFKEENKGIKRRIESESEDRGEGEGKAPEPDSKKRRIQPELVSTKPVSVPEDFDPSNLTEAEQAFLDRHRQLSDTESLRPYEESDQELEIGSDDSLYGDLDSEDEATPSPQLSSDAIYQIVDETIQGFKQDWITNKQPKKHKKAFRNWMRAAKAGTRKPQQNALRGEIANYEVRLEKLRKSVHDMSKEANKTEDIKHACQNLQPTVEDIAEREYYLQVLESDQAPPKPASMPIVIKAIPENLAEDEEILESEIETEEDEDNEISEPFLDDASLSESDVSLSYDPSDNDWNPQLLLRGTSEEAFGTSLELEKDASRSSTPENVQFQSADEFSSNDIPEPMVGALPAQLKTTPSRQRTPAFTECSNPIYYPQLPTPQLAKSSGTQSTPLPKVRQNTPNLLEVVQNSIEDQMDEEMEIDLFEDRLPQSRYRTQGATLADAIDLGSSPVGSEFSMASSIHTPPLNPETPTKYVEPRRALPPRYPPIHATRAMKYKDIGTDGFLLLCKSVYKRAREVAEDILDKIRDLGPAEIASALSAIISEWQDTVNGEEPFSEDEEDIDYVWTYLYIVFATGTHARQIEDVSEESLDIAFAQIPMKAGKFDKIIRPLLKWYIDTNTKPNNIDDNEALSTQEIKGTKQTARGFASNSHTVSAFVGGSRKSPTPPTDTESEDMVPSGSQKRKRHVTQSQEALQRQRDDRNRVEALEEQRRQLMMQRFQAFNGDENVVPIPINTAEPFVYLDKHIARRVKPHQVDGIQFLWRELIDDPKHQGCLLAHTMGLGKTMQVISFLVTLAQTNQSPQLRSLLPNHLRNNKVLVICPASLVDNWYDEILMWTPPGAPPILGATYRAHGTRKQKLTTVMAWNQTPGVLIIGYESLKALLKKHRNMSDHEFSDLEKSLLADPCVVVADEAHKLKNTKSAINKVAMQFATKSRIALTGSPLNNHLEEYHTMINWIAPNYLGTLTQFKAKYSEPIERGLYADSTRYDKRKSLEKLYVLKRDLAPKINRKDISAIAKDMPQKTEFFITVPLTELQRKIYTTMVEYILRAVSSSNGNAIKSTNAQLWAWLSILSWLCNHPSCLIRKLQEKHPEGGKVHTSLTNLQSLADDEFDESTVPDNFDVTEGPLSALLPQFLGFFEEIGKLGDKQDPDLSARSIVTRHLIEESVAQGEKILIFSHSIPTLDFLENMVFGMDLECMRIDGSKKTDQRQNATKYFNDENSDIGVFLISTRAGGLGLNLQGANRVIIYDFGFNPSWEEQAIGRAYRLGQKKPVFVYRFRAGGTFEETMYNKAIFKTQLFSRVVDQKNVIRHASKKIEDYLFVPKEAEKQDLSECLGKDALLDKIIHQIPDTIRGLILTETFQREDEEDEMTPDERKAAEEAYNQEKLARENPQEYARRILAVRAHTQQAQKVQPTYGGQKTQFEQVWSTKTINAAGSTPRPTQPAIDEAFEVLESGGPPEEKNAAPICRNQ